MQASEKVLIFGLGYIGLPTAATLANHKKQVIGVDINPQAVDTINRGQIHIIEPGLEELVATAVNNKYLIAQTTPEPADTFLIAVPTPFQEQHQPDLSYIHSAIQAMAPHLQPGNLIILESTSPVGTTEQICHWLEILRPDLHLPHQPGTTNLYIAYCPERVLPGKVIHELINNDRIIGGISQECTIKAQAFYQSFIQGHCCTTNARTAEMAKLTENSFRDVNIAFANELSMICDQLDINVWELIQLANRHPRVNILQPGPGVGGHCIAVDPWFIVHSAPKLSRLISSARHVNDSKPQWVFDKTYQLVGQYLTAHAELTVQDLTIACLGLSFKANIDDLRESPALAITRQLAADFKGKVLAVEPNIQALETHEKFILVTLDDALAQADIIILLVEHQPFYAINKQQLTDKLLLDTKGIWG